MSSPKWGRAVSSSRVRVNRRSTVQTACVSACAQTDPLCQRRSVFFANIVSELITKNVLRASGYALLEVLVALLILAIGVIGGAGLQLGAVITVKQSSLHGSAMALAGEIADSMRANSQRMAAGANDPFLQVDFKSSDTISAAAVNCLTASCNPDQLAASDIVNWEYRVQKELPEGRGLICRDSAPYSSGALVWSCSGTGPIVIKLGWLGKTTTGKLEHDADQTSGIGPPRVVLLLGQSGQPLEQVIQP